MRRTKLYSIITAILLVPLFGVQVIAQEKQVIAQEKYRLPDNNGIVTMRDILRENPSLNKKQIYGDIIKDISGYPSSDPATSYGGVKSGKSILNDPEKYGKENPGITFDKNDYVGLILVSREHKPIKSAKLYLAKYENNDWWKSDTCIILEHQTGAENNPAEEAGGATNIMQSASEPNIEPNQPDLWWVLCFFGGFLFGVVSLILLKKIAVSQTKKQPNEEMQGRNVGKQSNSGEKSLTKGEMEEIVNKITEKHSLELFAKLSKLVDEKFVRLESERRAQNNTIPNVTNSTPSVKEIRKAQRRETEEFCGYAQLPQNGDFALTLTQDPMRTAFVINKRGSDYLVGLIEDEQTLSQLVQPLSDLKANGSNIVDFPEGELQGAQKIVCVARGVFKEDSIGRIIPVNPIRIKRG